MWLKMDLRLFALCRISVNYCLLICNFTFHGNITYNGHLKNETILNYPQVLNPLGIVTVTISISKYLKWKSLISFDNRYAFICIKFNK
jgi:hypothetical protein